MTRITPAYVKTPAEALGPPLIARLVVAVDARTRVRLRSALGGAYCFVTRGGWTDCVDVEDPGPC